MAEAKTGTDAVEVRLMGATSNLGVQTDILLSLGDYMSATVVEFVRAASPTFSIGAAFTINRIGDGNGNTGTGTITATDSTSITWTPPGGAVGAAVSIANTEQKQIQGADKNQRIIVTRNDATALTGSAVVTVNEVKPTLFSNDDVSDAERVAGDKEYWSAAFRNQGTSDVKSLKVKMKVQGTQAGTQTTWLPGSGAGTIVTSDSFATWPSAGMALIRDSGGTVREIVNYTDRTDSGLVVPAAGRGQMGTSADAGVTTDTVDAIPPTMLALEQLGSNPGGNIQTIANESTQPTGRTWVVPITDAEAITIGDLQTLEGSAIWFERWIVAGETGRPDIYNHLTWSFETA